MVIVNLLKNLKNNFLYNEKSIYITHVCSCGSYYVCPSSTTGRGLCI